MVSVFKGGRKDMEDPAFYRPISVLPALSKVLETIVIEQFLDFLDENNLLPPAQHGFRQGHSTITALIKSIQKWTDQKGSAIASFDYSAAFDTISKETVQQRLDDVGANDNLDGIIHGRRQTKSQMERSSFVLPRQASRRRSGKQDRATNLHLRHNGQLRLEHLASQKMGILPKHICRVSC